MDVTQSREELVQAIGDDDLASVQRISASLPPSVLGWAVSAAAFWGHRRIVDFLVKYGCAVQDCDAAGYTPLHEAARSMNVNAETVRLLVESGADVNSEAEGGWRITPLHLVLHRIPLRAEDRRIVEYLLEKGARVNSLAEAVALEDERLALQMIGAGTPLEEVIYPSERTALHVAAMLNSVAVAAELIRRGVWLDAPNGEHQTALELASSDELRKMLLAAGARTNDGVWEEINSATTFGNFVKGIGRHTG